MRLDNFVFTRESLIARAALKPGGGIAVNFFAIKPWLAERHYDALQQAMNQEPLAYGSPELQEASFLAGTRFDADRPLGPTLYRPIHTHFVEERVEVTSDDWPFLFLERRGLPLQYVLPLLLILLLSLVPLRAVGVTARAVDWHLFFMGAAFLLIETKAITTLALLFGSTWITNSIVIAAILVIILLANALTPPLTRARSRCCTLPWPPLCFSTTVSPWTR